MVQSEKSCIVYLMQDKPFFLVRGVQADGRGGHRLRGRTHEWGEAGHRWMFVAKEVKFFLAQLPWLLHADAYQTMLHLKVQNSAFVWHRGRQTRGPSFRRCRGSGTKLAKRRSCAQGQTDGKAQSVAHIDRFGRFHFKPRGGEENMGRDGAHDERLPQAQPKIGWSCCRHISACGVLQTQK